MKKALSLVLTMCMVLSLFATFVVTASAEGETNIALGKTYTTTAPNRDDTYDDNGKKLTDGEAGLEDPGSAKSAIWNNDDKSTENVVEIVVDLGKTMSSSSFVVYFGGGNWGIGLPTEGTSVEVFASDSADSGFTSVASVAKTELVLKSGNGGATANSWSVYTATATAASAVNARYIKFVITAEAIGNAFIMLDEVEVYGTEVKETVETKVLNLDRANHYDWTNKDYNSTQYTPTASSAGEILFAASTDATASVGSRFGGDYFTWWYVILAEWNDAANAYVVTTIDLPGNDEVIYTSWTLGEGKIVVLCNTGYSSTEAAGNADDAAVIKEIVVGDKLTINGSDFATLAAASGALEGVSLTINAPAEDDGNEPEVIVETITVDGDLTDTGWLEDGWTAVSKDNGTFQGGIDSMKNDASKAFTYKFQMRTDDTKLYVAAIYDGDLKELDDKSYGTKFRLWINTNEEATVYTHFYDIYTKGGVMVAEGKYNTSTTDNKGAMIGATDTSTAYSGSFVGTMKEVGGKTYFEMSVDLAEFGGEDGFNYFFNAGFKTVDGDNVDNIQMLYPAVVVPTEEGADKLANFPYRKWATDSDATADVEALKLGERVVTPEEPAEEADTSMMGEAPEDSKFTATVTGPEAWKAGDKITVDVTIEVTADELALSQIMFNLFYDAADVEFVAGEDVGAVNVTTGADSWKGEDSTLYVTDYEGYGKLEVGLASLVEADALKKGDKIVVTFEFTVKDEAEGLINFQLSNEELVGYTYAEPDVAIAGIGSNLAIAKASDNLGDAGIYAIAALAIVALIGTAVVIKRRA